MPDVFISYKREERPRCQNIATKLAALGLDIWFDAKTEAGGIWEDEIEQQVTTSRAVLVLWSPLALKSKWVRAEARVGEEKGILVAARISPCEIPIYYQQFQVEDLLDPTFPDDDPAWRKILESIGRHCQRKDIEAWAKLESQATASQLRAWIDAHPDSPASLFLDVDARHRARAAVDEKRAQEEREVRWRRAIEGLNKSSSSAVKAFREKWPDHPEDEALRLSLPALELAKRRQAEREAFERLDKRSSKGIREFLQKLPNHPIAEVLRASLPKVEEVERQLAKEQAAREQQAGEEARRQAEHEKRGKGARRSLIVGTLVAALATLFVIFGPSTLRRQTAEAAAANYVPTSRILARGEDASGLADGAVFRDCAGCPEMVIIPGGSFIMGSPVSEPGHRSYERPQHTVTISAFAASKYEITVGQWEWAVAISAGHGHVSPHYGRSNNLPLTGVRWDNAQSYVEWLSQHTGLRYRLLSEAEWEYAARGGTRSAYWWGGSASHRYAKYGADWWSYISPVGSYPANPFGLHDMHGNVWEWVQDCWSADYSNAGGNGAANTTGNCSWRVVRGGSFHSPAGLLRSANRDGGRPLNRSNQRGFRVARSTSEG